MDKEGLLRKIDSVSFMLTDLCLYLDTHPDDGRAAEAFRHYRKERKALMEEFETKFYPLTLDCCCEANPDSPSALDRALDKKNGDGIFCWGKGSEPWKGEAYVEL